MFTWHNISDHLEHFQANCRLIYNFRFLIVWWKPALFATVQASAADTFVSIVGLILRRFNEHVN